MLFPYVGDSVGGAQVSGVTLIENLDRKIFEPIVVLHEVGPFAAYLKAKGVEFEVVPLRAYLGQKAGLLNHLFAVAVTLPVLFKYLILREIRIVHAQDSRMNLTWILPAKLAAIPFVWHQRSKFANSRLLAVGARMATQIISISEFTFSTIPQKLQAFSSTIENPVNAEIAPPNRELSRAQLCRDLKLDPAQPVVGFFGNLTKHKRPEIFIKITSEFSASNAVPATFVLFGADRDGVQMELEAMVKSLGLEHQVVFAGFVMEPERCMAGCDLIIAPGVDDAFGRTVVEAMLVGTLVIAADSGGHKQIIRDGQTGFLVSPDNVSEYVSAVKKVLSKGKLSQAMRRSAMADVSSRYSVKNHIKKII